MSKIKSKHIFSQLKADLIGKDSHRGVTLTYSWMANQVGHFSLGFIPTLLVFSLFNYLKISNNPAFFAALVVSATWLVFELYNFLGPLLKKKKSASKIFYIPGKLKYQFSPAWGNIAFDTFTDLCYFWIGAWCASYYLLSSTTALICILAFIVVAMYPTAYWFLTKMFLQNAQYPKQYRLSQWDFGISADGKKIVLEFIDLQSVGHHLFILGGAGSGKTSISIGIASEMSIKRNAGWYITATKLLSAFCQNEKSNDIWDWRSANLMIVDDITTDHPSGQTISPSTFIKYMDMLPEFSAKNRENLKNKNVIWVLGTDVEDQNILKEWIQMLTSLGVSEEKMKFVHL